MNRLSRIAENNSTAQPLEMQTYMQKPHCRNKLAAISFITLCLQAPPPLKKTQPNSSLCVHVCVCVCACETEYASVHVPQSPSLICRGFAASTAAKTLRADPDHRRKNEAGSERRPRTPPQLPRQAGELGAKRHRLYLWSANTDHLPYVHRGSAAPLARPLGPGSAASA